MINFKDYPYWAAETLENIKDQLMQICNIRKDDITQISNLVNIFISGRKVGKIPSASNDVDPTDKINDFNWEYGTPPYLYILMDNAGTAEWVRFEGEIW